MIARRDRPFAVQQAASVAQGRVLGRVLGRALGRALGQARVLTRRGARALIMALAISVSTGVASANAAFPVQSLAGERVDLHDYLGGGQWTLVMLWTTDCIPCEEQKPMIEAFHTDHINGYAKVIGLALDGPSKRAEIDRLIEHHKPSYTNLLAFDDVFARQFSEETGKRYTVTPTYILYKPDGSFFGVHAGKVSRKMLDSAVSQ